MNVYLSKEYFSRFVSTYFIQIHLLVTTCSFKAVAMQEQIKNPFFSLSQEILGILNCDLLHSSIQIHLRLNTYND